ncbi:emp24p/erv25p- protein [Irineochytrium annulatum]|nr:emp24p/erv25p- protein [Irineochytrium annulatum]
MGRSQALLLAFALLLAIASTDALYFILEGSEQKCFIEELPKETTVIGTYSSLEWSDQAQLYQENSANIVSIVVEEQLNRHRLVEQKASNKGKFTFTTSEAGDHSICITANGGGGWFSSSKTKFYLDLMFGDASHDTTSHTKTAVNDITSRIRELNNRVDIIQREQRYQREREAEFRNASEAINAKVVNWTLAQVAVLVVTALWQIRHLKQFFVSKKLVDQRVAVNTANGITPGSIRFIGETAFAAGKWVGIELDVPNGKNDGSVNGERYFDTEPMRGVFVRPTQVKSVSVGAANAASESK